MQMQMRKFTHGYLDSSREVLLRPVQKPVEILIR
jgi:hypothetical protein